jgi:Bor protein
MKRALLFALLLPAAACFRTTISNGNPVGHAPIDYDEKWHSGVILGIAELSGPYDLQKICPQGWSQIHTGTSAAAAFVTWITAQIYTPQRVTIRCASSSTR